jgi:hypothetical protein
MAVGPVLASAGGKGKYRRRVRIAILLTFNIIIKFNLTILLARPIPGGDWTLSLCVWFHRHARVFVWGSIATAQASADLQLASLS